MFTYCANPTAQGSEGPTTPQTAQFNPLEVGLIVRCDDLTQGQSDPFSAPPGGGDSSDHDTQMALLKNGAVPPERLHPRMGQPGASLT
jgi:hypothetical protein